MKGVSTSRTIIPLLRRIRRLDVSEYWIAITGAAIIIIVSFIAILAPVIAPYDPIEPVGGSLEPPNTRFLLGTDNIGRDILSRIIYGSRISLSIAFLASIFSMIIGASLGLLSGYIGGVFDTALALIMDSMYAFPSIILAIAIAYVLGPGILNVTISIGIVYIPVYFRMIRSEVLSVKESLYVEAAKAIGASDRVILLKYILPNVTASLPVVFSLNATDAILTEAALSFLGLGLPAPTPDWGFDLRNGYHFITAGYWWTVTFPGLMIIITALGFSLFSEGLNEILNPRLREV